MKIKLALLENDQNYLNRMVAAFGSKYADKIQIYSFSNLEMAMSTLETAKIDVLVANESFDIDVKSLPKYCGFAYFVDSLGVDTINGQRAICKFQKADLIYKTILSVYAEKAGSLSGIKVGDDSAKVIAFCSVSSGAGASTMAAATAIRYAMQNKKTLYLNLEKFGSSDVFFSGEGQFDMSDVIFAIKSKKANLSLKLESCVKQDKRGVYFYSQSKIALDILELSPEDIGRIISEAKLAGGYNYIILDMGFALDKETLEILHQVHSVVWVGDGSKISNLKVSRAYKALEAMEQSADLPLKNRICMIYNKFSSRGSQIMEGLEVRNIGGAPKYENASVEQVVEQLSKMEMLDKLIG